MKIQYQFVLIGNNNPFKSEIVTLFLTKVKELGLPDGSVIIINAEEIGKFKSNAPTVCVYFGGEAPFDHLNILNLIIDNACFVIPVFDGTNEFSNSVPGELVSVNGFKLQSRFDFEKLVNRILEGFSLLRKKRGLFISYRRIDSRSIALQLYNFLDEQGFDVFLDTHSIDAGAVFQDELWHSLADADVLVLLNTKNFVGNKWTDLELAQASDMSVGIVQLVWPDCNNGDYVNKTAFATPIYLRKKDFVCRRLHSKKAQLKSRTLKKIGLDIESIRARSLAARQDNLIQEFFKCGARHKVFVNLQPEKIFILTNSKGNNIAVIPMVGVPDAYSSYEKEIVIRKVWSTNVKELHVLYDQRNIIKNYLDFVEAWLNVGLPVKHVSLLKIDDWFLKL